MADKKLKQKIRAIRAILACITVEANSALCIDPENADAYFESILVHAKDIERLLKGD